MKKHLTLHNLVVAVTFTLILVTGIIFKENPFFLIPAFTSLAVMSLQARVSRWGYLLGGINCIAYGVVYWFFGAYGVAVSMIAVTTPMQLITFFNWSKRERQEKTLLKKMTGKQRVLWCVVLLLGGAVLQTILMRVGSKVAFLDNLSTVISTAVSLLTMFAYAEYVYLWPVSCLISVLLQVQIAVQDIRQIPYLIYSLYSLYCVVVALFRVKKTYLKKTSTQANAQ